MFHFASNSILWWHRKLSAIFRSKFYEKFITYINVRLFKFSNKSALSNWIELKSKALERNSINLKFLSIVWVFSQLIKLPKLGILCIVECQIVVGKIQPLKALQGPQNFQIKVKQLIMIGNQPHEWIQVAKHFFRKLGNQIILQESEVGTTIHHRW